MLAQATMQKSFCFVFTSNHLRNVLAHRWICLTQPVRHETEVEDWFVLLLLPRITEQGTKRGIKHIIAVTLFKKTPIRTTDKSSFDALDTLDNDFYRSEAWNMYRATGKTARYGRHASCPYMSNDYFTWPYQPTQGKHDNSSHGQVWEVMERLIGCISTRPAYIPKHYNSAYFVQRTIGKCVKTGPALDTGDMGGRIGPRPRGRAAPLR